MSKVNSKCAIVGNSGALLNSSHGKLIDSHDYVIRFNLAPTEGYENHVGTKTSLRIVNCHMFNSLLPNSSKHYKEIFSKFDPNYALKMKNENVLLKDSINVNTFAHVFEIMKNNGCTLNFVDPTTIQIISKQLNLDSGGPTSGIIGIFIAKNMFKKVSCFGFSFYEDPWESKHYFENIKPYAQSKSHTLDKEKDWVHELNQKKEIELYR